MYLLTYYVALICLLPNYDDADLHLQNMEAVACTVVKWLVSIGLAKLGQL